MYVRYRADALRKNWPDMSGEHWAHAVCATSAHASVFALVFPKTTQELSVYVVGYAVQE